MLLGMLRTLYPHFGVHVHVYNIANMAMLTPVFSKWISPCWRFYHPCMMYSIRPTVCKLRNSILAAQQAHADAGGNENPPPICHFANQPGTGLSVELFTPTCSIVIRLPIIVRFTIIQTHTILVDI